MPFGPSPARFKPGMRAIPSARLNAPLELLQRLGSLRMGGYTAWTPAGPQGRPEGLVWRLGMTGSDGIAASSASSGGDMTIFGADVFDVDLVTSQDGYSMTLSTNTTTYIGMNLSSQAVAGSTLIISLIVEGAWMTIWENCPATSS
jgi:hypothetical protein